MHNDARYKHIIFTDRQNIPDMKPVPETMKIAQISGLKERNAQGQWVISTSFLPCSCPPCRDDITSAPDNCLYKNERRIKEQLVIPAGNDAAKDDAYGMRSLTVAQLKLELRARDLSTAGLKADLIVRIVAALQERDTVVTPEAQLTEHDFEEEDRMLDGEMIVQRGGQPLHDNSGARRCTLSNAVAGDDEEVVCLQTTNDYAAGEWLLSTLQLLYMRTINMYIYVNAHVDFKSGVRFKIRT